MDVKINQQPVSLPEGASIADALAAYGARPPYAVAVNGEHVARARHSDYRLNVGDALDIVAPVAGG
ncbi:MAG: sulfur carrier protein ThiS [Janthinobacterium lividum]